MKRLLSATCISLALVGSGMAFAEGVGVVDMRQIFQDSPQAKKITDELNQRFASQKNRIVEMNKNLQNDMQKFQRDQAVMDKNQIERSRTEISQEEEKLRNAQMQLQQEYMNAQNQAMGDFMDKVARVSKTVAEKKKLDLVLPKNIILYSKNSVDITTDVQNKLGK